jgi:two-component system, response regulator YesN
MEGIDKYFISIGSTVKGLVNVSASYNKAMSNMKMIFFEGYNKILNIDEINYPEFNLNTRPIKNIIELIEETKYTQMIFYIKSLTSELKLNRTTPINNIKNYFTSICLELYRYSKYKGIDIFQDTENEISIREVIQKFDTLSEIEEFLIDKLNIFFENTNHINKCSTINKIHKYIQDYYGDENLSINKISEYTHFAPTYVCSLFKGKTGKTLNQYITEYRVEKSKTLLMDMKLNVSDIGSLVGFSKSGYFTKLFKKVTGITPSEYRERSI